MKILILTNSDVGLYLFRKELISELLKDNEVHIALPFGDYITKFKDMSCKLYDTPMDRRGMNPIKDFGLLTKYFFLEKKIQPDLVVTYTIKPNIYGGIISSIRGVHYACNITGLGTAFETGRLVRKFVSIMYKVALKKAKVVFFENKNNRDFFKKEKLVRKSQQCVLNGAGVNLSSHVLLPYPEDKQVFYFLFMGRVMKEKGIDELLLVVERLNEEGNPCFLDIVGEMEENHRSIIKKFEKKSWIRYHGFQSDVKPFIEKSHCAVLPSWHEGMSNTNLECAAAGRPIITSNIPGCREAVIEEVTGYLSEAKNSSSLYICMKKMMKLTYEERKKMGELGREHMERYFDRHLVIHKTLDRLMG